MENNYLPVLAYGLKKSEIKELVNEVVEKINSGTVAAERVLMIAEQLSAVADFAAGLKTNEDFAEAVRTELMKHPKGYLSPSGAKLEAIEAGTKYDYSDDSKWLSLNAELATLKDKMKERETLLKAIPAGVELADPETGEVITAPTKTSTSTFKITLAK
jgi:hypothetical protein